MHLSDAVLSLPVAAVGLALGGGSLAVAVRSMGRTDMRRTAEMGVWGAFVFAVQMINVAIPGTGASGHLVGTVLLCFLIGPARALLTMTAVLAVQALLFGDGGLLALGWNVWNMGAIPVLCTLVFLRGEEKGMEAPSGWLPVPAAMLAVELGALSASLAVLLSGRVQLPPLSFLVLMGGIHLPVGAVEGLVSAWIIRSVRRNGLLDDVPAVTGRGRLSGMVGVVLLSLVLAGGISHVASTRPDGLEWSLFRGSQQVGSSLPEEPAFTWKWALFEDYLIPGADAPMQSVPGIVGSVVVLAVAAGLGWMVRRRRGNGANSSHD